MSNEPDNREIWDTGGDDFPPPPRRPKRNTTPGTLPEKLADYRLGTEIGRGGMSLVLRADDTRLDRPVALKLILSGVYSDRKAREQFLAEARMTARMRHPNIVQIYDVGEENGIPYMALEFVDGGTLARAIALKPMTPADAAVLVETLARAVAYAHSRGVIHRDLKPANVLLSSDGPKVADFGVALILDPGASAHSGVLAGTPNYMAPEQADSRKDVGPPADVYALGAILYECLTSRPPFKAATPLETLDLVKNRPPVPPAALQPGVPEDLDTICLKCLDKEPGRRYSTAEELAEDLARYRHGRPIIARPVGRAERVWRWIRRNPIDASLVGTLALAIAIGFAGVLWQWMRAESLFDQAESRRKQIEQLYEESEIQKQEALDARAETARSLKELQTAVNDTAYLINTIDLDELFNFRALPIRKELLEPALRENREFLRSHGDDPDREPEIVAAYFRIAILTRLTGTIEQALDAGKKALDRQKPFVDSHKEVIQYKRDLAASYHNVGFLTNAGNQPEEALAYLKAARVIREELLDTQPDNLDYRSELAGVQNDIGLAWFALAEPRQDPAMFATAEQMFRSALDAQRRVVWEAPHIVRYRILASHHAFNLARQLALKGHVSEVLPLMDLIQGAQPNDPKSVLRAARVLALASRHAGPMADTLADRAIELVKRACQDTTNSPGTVELHHPELQLLKGRRAFDEIVMKRANRSKEH